ncbi:serine/threonine-protein kinase [Candidatus Uabimicrobium amorphum]|uniref:Serine/threonine protein kinase n=1 Tax=Uabimicrobium amorphum TaxID=2596890 RepID=A0A5S9IPR7_UABAM|nr:serine/threonine-protein kinase [Candidatus Uabimicrobium amorphum]BBM85211.1 serine/threonine protein kinase [Candidatus Uabimicrobium amorphum]
MDVTQNQSIVQRYKILKEIGQGGMGRVYKAYDKNLDTEVAIKVLLAGESANDKQKTRFLREAQALLALRHKNIIHIYDVFSQPQLFFTMEYVDGCTLREYQQQHSRKQTIDVLMKVARAVHYMHENGIIHRDLKPSNILVTKEGEPVVMDFGLAKMMDSSGTLTKTGDVMGTVKYASPEQIFGKPVDKTTDIYSLGVILYEIVYKRNLFEAKSHENLLFAILNDKPEFTGNVSGELQRICKKALAKNKEQRYENAAQFARDLRNFQNGMRTRSRSKQGGSLHIVGIVVAAVVFIFALLGIFLQQSTEEIPYEKTTNSATKEAQQHFARYLDSYEKYELEEAWQHLKNAIAQNPRPAYYVHAWHLNSCFIRYGWDDPIIKLKRKLIQKEFSSILTAEFFARLQSSEDFLDIYSLALIKQMKKSATRAELIAEFEKCWKKSSYSQAAERLLGLYYHEKGFDYAQRFFLSIKKKSPSLYEKHAYLCKLEKRDSYRSYLTAANKGHLDAKCSVAAMDKTSFEPIANEGYARAIRAVCQSHLAKRSADAEKWLKRLQNKQQQLLAYSLYDLEGFIEKGLDKNKLKAQHHFDNFRMLFDCFYVDLAWCEIREAIRLDPDNFVYYIYASQLYMTVLYFVYEKPDDKNEARQKEIADTLRIVKNMVPENPQTAEEKSAKAVYLWYLQKKTLGGKLFEEAYEKHGCQDFFPNLLSYYIEFGKHEKAFRLSKKVMYSDDSTSRAVLACGRVFNGNERVAAYEKSGKLGNINGQCAFYDVRKRQNHRLWLSIALADFYRAFSHLQRIDRRHQYYWSKHAHRKLKDWSGYSVASLR